MGWLKDVLSGGAEGVIRGTLDGAGNLAKDIRSAITGDMPPEKAAELEARAQELEAKVRTAQMEVNRAEARHSSIFVAGWRPAIGWCGALALFYQFLARPLLLAFTAADMPSIETGAIWPIVAGMLGLGGMRSWEKGRGVQDKH